MLQQNQRKYLGGRSREVSGTTAPSSYIAPKNFPAKSNKTWLAGALDCPSRYQSSTSLISVGTFSRNLLSASCHASHKSSQAHTLVGLCSIWTNSLGTFNREPKSTCLPLA